MKDYREQQKQGTKDFPFAHYKEHLVTHRINLHWHPEIEMIYVLGGRLKVTVSEEVYILTSGDILFINPEELHSYAAAGTHADYHAAVLNLSWFQFKELHFFEQDFVKPLLNGTLRFRRLFQADHPQYDLLESLLLRLFQETRKNKAMIFADLTLIFATLLQYSLLENVEKKGMLQKSENIKKSINYMEENCGRKITLEEIANHVNMSPNYFCNYFKTQTGVTPFAQINNIRIKKASKLLLETTDSILNISEICGFENVSFFIRKFKEINECTPSVYRKKYK